ncbi:MAG: type II secretion system F family protein [Methanosarcinales archaeon]|nr:type II secretion system F family protein [Methanosarcinales archaeon]
MYIPAVLYKSFILFALFSILFIGVWIEIALFISKATGWIEETQFQISAAFVFLAAAFIFILTALVFYFLPYFKAYDRRIKIEQQLPFAVNYMAAMAIAGVSIENIFKSMSQRRIHSVYPELSDEMKTIEIQTDYFGKDYPSALQKTADVSPSPMLSDFIIRSKNAMISGGSFQKFIVSKKHEYQSLAVRRKESYFQTLDMLSEIYITVFLAMPLFFMILFYTMTPLSGPQTDQMSALAYKIVPFLGCFFLLVLEVMNEKEDI